MTNISSVMLLNIQRVHVSAYYRIKIKYTVDHNQKLLQALDDGLKWVSKYINNYIFKCSLMLIVLLIIF